MWVMGEILLKGERFCMMKSSKINTMSYDIKLGYDLDLYKGYGKMQYVYWNPEKHPMMLVVGATNSGKSYFLKLIMGHIATSTESNDDITKKSKISELYLCDFKDIDFRDYSDCPRRWSYEHCIDGLTEFYNSFQARLEGLDTTTNRKFLIFDEWAAFVLSRSDKKIQDNVKSMMSTLLMVGRGVRHHVICGLQRADSQLFPNGGREQFGMILAFGNLSREQKLMIVPDFRDDMTEINRQGQGYLYLDGDSGLKRLQVPTIHDHEKLHLAIRSGLTR